MKQFSKSSILRPPGPGDALLVVDVQNDFLPGGNLAVPEGQEVLPPLNRCLASFRRKDLPVYASRDWHPADHCSFREQGGPWPPHCVAETEGAAFAAELDLPDDAVIISKADTQQEDAYSAFQRTGLGDQLRHSNIRRLFIGGLATDYCVLNTVRDALDAGFEVVLLCDAIRAVNVQPEDGRKAEEEMAEGGAHLVTTDDLGLGAHSPGPLLTDLYQLAMLKAYRDRGMNGTAVFEFYIRSLPQARNFLMAAGLEQVLEYLETLRFSDDDLQKLADSGRFPDTFLHSLESLRFTGDVEALPEGTVFFADEPVLRVTAPLCEAQLVESRIINILQYQILIASKAARMVLAAPGKTLVDFGLRRSHGAEAGLFAARASYLAGFAGTATVPAESAYGIPLFGTMAHSFVLAHGDETQAFEDFARSWPDNAVLLLDTFDTEAAARKTATLSQRLKSEGISVRGVRLDSGDLLELSRRVRDILDSEGCEDIDIFASGGLDEYALQSLESHQAPIDGYGIGTRLAVSEDVPSLDAVYKLQEYEGRPRRKRSAGKATWPGRKQILRRYNSEGKLLEDHLVLEDDPDAHEGLLQPAMRRGRRVRPPQSLHRLRQHAAEQLNVLPETLRSLEAVDQYPVHISQSIRDLAKGLDRQNS